MGQANGLIGSFDAKRRPTRGLLVGKIIAQRVVVPSYLLNDPDFVGATSILIGANGESSGDTHSSSTQSTNSNATGTINTLLPASYKYMDLPLESHNLDALLYDVLLMSVQGSENALLQCVIFPSYVQAQIVLNKHMDISRSDQKSHAFSHMDQLKYTGDPHAFEVHAVGAWREITDSKCSIKDYAMTRAMKAFDGVSKTTQHKIAKDLNNNDLESLNFFDLIHSYCSDLASVGDTKQQVNLAAGSTESPSDYDTCDFCGKPGQKGFDCFKRKAASKTAKEKTKQKCNKCWKHGHSAEVCKSEPEENFAAQGDAAAEQSDQRQLQLALPEPSATAVNQINYAAAQDQDRVSISQQGLLSILQALEHQQNPQ